MIKKIGVLVLQDDIRKPKVLIITPVRSQIDAA